MGTRALILMLGSAQTLAWASSYYLPAILAEPIAREMGIEPSTVFGAFSLALIVSAATGPFTGHLIDKFGGRSILMASNCIFALGLFLLAHAHTSATIFSAWAVMGVAMGCGLYEAAFATIVKLHDQKSRNVITGITLLAGFASTVGWPLTSYLSLTWGWREACTAWAFLHVFVGLPLNALLPKYVGAKLEAKDNKEGTNFSVSPNQQRRAVWVLSFVFASSWFISTAMAAHLPRLLVASGATLAIAVSIAALVGPAQVVGRILEYAFLKRAHPLLSARLATLAHPLACVCLGLVGVPAAFAFAIIHGLGNGILTIAIGTLPLFFFGAKGYGQRQGMLMVPARLVQAGAPFLFGLALERWNMASLWLSAILGLLSCVALLTLHAERDLTA